MPRDVFDSAMQDSTLARVMPPAGRFMFPHLSSMTTRFPLDSAFSADSTFRSTTQHFDQMMARFRVVMYGGAIGFAALFGWIIAKLLSRPIREEFGVT